MPRSPTSRLIVQIQCNATDGSLATTPFAVAFYRLITPAPNAFATTTAYAWVTETGTTPSSYNYNASGTLNTASLTSTGNDTIPNATNVNAMKRAAVMMFLLGGATAVAEPQIELAGDPTTYGFGWEAGAGMGVSREPDLADRRARVARTWRSPGRSAGLP